MTTMTRPAPAPHYVSGPCCTRDGSSDPAVLYLWDLMAGGLSQPEASLIAFGDAPDLPSAPSNTAGWVRRVLLARVPWLRETGAASPLLLAGGWLVAWVAVVAWAVVSR